jgi:hypothetical protein
MRVLFGAAAMAMLISSSAMAQTEGAAPAAPVPPSECAALPTAPTLPDGAQGTREQMDAGNTAYNAWGEAYRAALACRRTEAEALQARWRARVAEYNAAAESLNTQSGAWEAEVQEFNARSPAARRGTTRN